MPINIIELVMSFIVYDLSEDRSNFLKPPHNNWVNPYYFTKLRYNVIIDTPCNNIRSFLEENKENNAKLIKTKTKIVSFLHNSNYIKTLVSLQAD